MELFLDYNVLEICLFKTQVGFETEHLSHSPDLQDYEKLPDQGLRFETVLKEAKKYISLGHSNWKTGSESGTVYNGTFVYPAYLLINKHNSFN